MDPNNSEIGISKPQRRSTRRTKGFDVDVQPRDPIQTRKRGSKVAHPVRSVSGPKDVEDSAEHDGESPNKRNRRDTGGVFDGGDGGDEMDFLETTEDLEKKQEPEMTAGEGFLHSSIPSSPGNSYIGDKVLPVILPLRVEIDSTETTDVSVLRSRRPIHTNHSTDRNIGRVEPPRDAPVATYATQVPLKENRSVDVADIHSSMAQYREKKEASAKSTGYSGTDYYNMRHYSKPELLYKNISEKRTSKNQGTKKTAVTKGSRGSSSVGAKKPAVTKGSSELSYTWAMWFCSLLKLVFAALGVAVLSVLAYQYFPGLHWPEGGREFPSISVMPEEFVAHLSALKTQFPNQRPEFWRRSRVHLERHLRTAQPTEPVSLLLTAGLRAEKTLACLAKHLASSFSSALNASVLHIDGVSKSKQDSDQVKLDIDSQLRTAFEGDKPVAVIHRFEELPPGSTLIFYRYCDHENAAYKKVFLAFTVLLPHDEVDAQKSLKEVEEMVQDHVHDKFLGSSSQKAFNNMDADKLSGLWSRISHLILPVAAESDIEQKGC